MPNPESLDDDDELELEPVDQEVVEFERRRANRQTREAESRAATAAAYEDSQQFEPIEFDEFKHFRFTTRHLLLATAVLSIFMTLVTVAGCNGLFVAGLVALAAGWWYVLRRERRRAVAREARRREIEASIEARRAAEEGEPVPASIPVTVPEEPLEYEESEPPRFRLDFSLSMKQMLGALAVAVVLLTLANLFGRENAALLLGLVALVGLGVHVMGVELPGLLIFGWWILQVLYLLMSFWAAIGSLALVAI